jgi:hypothetical protein
MIAAVSPEVSASSEPAAESSEPAVTQATHWLTGRYFVPMPDLRDEVREQISKGKAWPVFSAIMSLLHSRERRGPKSDRLDAVAGRINGLGVAGLAIAARMSPGAVLRQVRVLEALGLLKTTQAEFTTETDRATGKIVRNYKRVPPKGFQVTIEDRHMRPAGASRRHPGGTHEPDPKPAGGTHETDPNGGKFRVRNRRVSKERTSKEVRSFGTNRRRTAAGPQERPAAAAAKGSSPQRHVHDSCGRRTPLDEDAARRAALEAFIQDIASTMGMTVPQVTSTPAGPERDDLLTRYHAAHGRLYDPHTGKATPLSAITPRPARKPRPSRWIDGIPPGGKAGQEGVGVPGVSGEGHLDADAASTAPEEAGADTQEPAHEPAAEVAHLDPPDHREPLPASPVPVSVPGGPEGAADGPVGSRLAPDTLTADEAEKRLRESLDELPDESRQRAADLGQRIDEAENDVARLADLIQRRRGMGYDYDAARRYAASACADRPHSTMTAPRRRLPPRPQDVAASTPSRPGGL